MKPALYRLLQIGLGAFCCLCSSSKISSAQVTPDSTVNTQVEQDGGVAEITGGETRGSNLFHSFEDFSVPTNNEAFFYNAESIGSIFSRVTGGDASNIDGAIRANGAANLFLINPAGIIFGENASLNIGGSFYGSTADSIIFPEGEFSATAPESESVLTVEVPIGLGFGSSPGNITNSSVANDGNGLEVAAGKDITLLGGDINFDRGAVTASGGIVNLGGLATDGEVGINENGSFSFPEATTRSSVFLSNTSSISNLSEQGGSIFINAQNLSLTSGSSLNPAPENEMDLAGVRSGEIAIDVLDSVTIDGTDAEGNPSGVFGVTDAENNSGELNIATSNLSVTNGGQIANITFGRGSAGNISIEASESIEINGQNSADFPSTIFSDVASDAEGDAAGVKITTDSLSVTNGGQITASTFGRGDVGLVDITAEGNISIDGDNTADFLSIISGSVASDAEGDAAGVKITTDSLSVTNGGQITASTFGRGDGGSIDVIAEDTISIDGENSAGSSSRISSEVELDAEGDVGEVALTTGSLSLTDGGVVSSGTLGQGNVGSVDITAKDTIFIDGENSAGIPSRLSNTVEPDGKGNGGDLNITAKSLSLTNGGQVAAVTTGQGNAGSVDITIEDAISISDQNSTSASSGVFSTVNEDAEGDAGGIKMTGGSLSLTDGTQINAGTFGRGNAGSVDITIEDAISIDSLNSAGASSGVYSTVNEDAGGDAGGIKATAGSLSLTNGGQIDASTLSIGNAGSVDITIEDAISIDGRDSAGASSGVFSLVQPNAEGDAASITITTNSLSLTDGGGVIAGTLGQGNGGSVDITAKDTISIDGQNSSSILSSSVGSDAEGDAGGVRVTSDSLLLTNGGQINASTSGQGNGGSVEITIEDEISIDGQISADFPTGVFSTVQKDAEGNAGQIKMTGGFLSLTNAGQISAGTFGRGNGGSVEITIDDSISIDGQNSAGFSSGVFSTVQPDAEGDAGGINMTAGSLSLTNGGEVSASTFGRGNGGSVEITIDDSISIGSQNLAALDSGISSTVQPDAEGDAGGINLTARSLSLANGGQINASTFGRGNGGSVEITIDDSISIDSRDSADFPSGVFSSVEPDAEGDAGRLIIKANSLSLDNNAEISAVTNSGGGNINLQIAEDLTLENNSTISARAFEDANGGNLSIDAKFIVASPNQNNDLVASAERGTGGNIDIVSSGIFGLEERSSNPPNNTNDIDASSELGVDGTVNLNTNYDFLNSFELIKPEFIVGQKALENSCFARRNSQQGSFVYGGTGGLPVSPDSPIEEEASMSSRLSRVKPNLPSANPLEVSSAVSQREWQIGDPIVEPTDLIKTADGRLLWVNAAQQRQRLCLWQRSDAF